MVVSDGDDDGENMVKYSFLKKKFKGSSRPLKKTISTLHNPIMMVMMSDDGEGGNSAFFRPIQRTKQGTTMLQDHNPLSPLSSTSMPNEVATTIGTTTNPPHMSQSNTTNPVMVMAMAIMATFASMKGGVGVEVPYTYSSITRPSYEYVTPW